MKKQSLIFLFSLSLLYFWSFQEQIFAQAVLDQEPSVYEPKGEFPWGIHLITIPLTIVFGFVLGWIVRERLFANEQAHQALKQKTHSTS